jgi:hypothetical protein
MDPTSSIRKLGFRRWYERQLIDSHLALVTCILSGIAVAICLDSVNFKEFGWRPFSMLLLVFAALVLAWISFRRYITVLQRAELYGQRSTCENCHAYGRFEILATGMDKVPGDVANAVAPLDAAWLRVKCRMCGTAWRIPE